MWMVVSERAWLVEKQSQQGRNCMKMCVKMTLFMTVDGGRPTIHYLVLPYVPSSTYNRLNFLQRSLFVTEKFCLKWQQHCHSPQGP